MAKKNISKNKCRFCLDRVSIGRFCDKDCEHDFHEYSNININPMWVNKTLKKLNCIDQTEEIIKFSKRHKVSLRLLTRKLRNKFNIKRCDEE